MAKREKEVAPSGPVALTPIEEFLKTGVSKTAHKKTPVVFLDDHGWIVHNNMLFPFYDDNAFSDEKQFTADELAELVEETLDGIEDEIPAAILVPQPKGKGFILVRNGDDDENRPERFIYTDDTPYTLSPTCIGRILNLKGDEAHIQAAKLLATGKVKIVEIVPDETVYCTDAEQKYLDANGHEKTAKHYHAKHRGFTLMSSYWHRSGAVLFSQNRTYYLMGQDGDSYFAVELPKKAGSVAEAFDVLKPDEAKDLINPLRQGEWFFIPVDEEDVPEPAECQFFGGQPDNGWGCNDGVEFNLPIDDPQSNVHTVRCDSWRLKDGVIYAEDPSMVHDQHEEVEVSGWFTFARNTAVRSVSIQGVD